MSSLTPSKGLCASSAPKRKREPSPHPLIQPSSTLLPSSIHSSNNSPSNPTILLSTILSDAVTYLEDLDTSPSILNFDLSNSQLPSSPNSSPVSKRLKTNNSNQLNHHPPIDSIATKVKSAAYPNLSVFISDLRTAIQSLQSKFQSAHKSRPSSTVLKFTFHLRTFLHQLHSILSQESLLRPALLNYDNEILSLSDSSPFHSILDLKQSSLQLQHHNVLTVFANAQETRQLFSSTQCNLPAKCNSKTDPGPNHYINNPSHVIEINDTQLPNQVSVTRIIPTDLDELEGHPRQSPTFGELFSPPAKLPPLEIPKIQKNFTTRSNNLTFVSWDVLSRLARKSVYNWTQELLLIGRWLCYRNTSPSRYNLPLHMRLKVPDVDPLANKFTGSLKRITPAVKYLISPESIFFSVYSSFAPTHDNSAALIPAQTKADYWWYKFGKKRFESHNTIPAVSISTVSNKQPTEEIPQIIKDEKSLNPVKTDFSLADDSTLQELLESYDPAEDYRYYQQTAGPNIDADNTESILRKISENLETLYSYQRRRNSVIVPPNSSRLNAIDVALLSITGTPNEPSKSEIDLYELLKRQFMMLLAKLPPYLVSKVNGDKFGDLMVSQVIPIVEEDHYGLLAQNVASQMTRATVGDVTRLQNANALAMQPQYATPNVAGRGVAFQTPATWGGTIALSQAQARYVKTNTPTDVEALAHSAHVTPQSAQILAHTQAQIRAQSQAQAHMFAHNPRIAVAANQSPLVHASQMANFVPTANQFMQGAGPQWRIVNGSPDPAALQFYRNVTASSNIVHSPAAQHMVYPVQSNAPVQGFHSVGIPGMGGNVHHVMNSSGSTPMVVPSPHSPSQTQPQSSTAHLVRLNSSTIQAHPTQTPRPLSQSHSQPPIALAHSSVQNLSSPVIGVPGYSPAGAIHSSVPAPVLTAPGQNLVPPLHRGIIHQSNPPINLQSSPLPSVGMNIGMGIPMGITVNTPVASSHPPHAPV